jgi:hypothetical protein
MFRPGVAWVERKSALHAVRRPYEVAVRSSSGLGQVWVYNSNSLETWFFFVEFYTFIYGTTINSVTGSDMCDPQFFSSENSRENYDRAYANIEKCLQARFHWLLWCCSILQCLQYKIALFKLVSMLVWMESAILLINRVIVTFRAQFL